MSDTGSGREQVLNKRRMKQEEEPLLLPLYQVRKWSQEECGLQGLLGSLQYTCLSVPQRRQHLHDVFSWHTSSYM